MCGSSVVFRCRVIVWFVEISKPSMNCVVVEISTLLLGKLLGWRK